MAISMVNEKINHIRYILSIYDEINENFSDSKLELHDNIRYITENNSSSNFLPANIVLFKISKGSFLVECLMHKEIKIDSTPFIAFKKKFTFNYLKIGEYKRMELMDTEKIDDESFTKDADFKKILAYAFGKINELCEKDEKHPDKLTSDVLFKLNLPQWYIPSYMTFSISEENLKELSSSKEAANWYHRNEFNLSLNTNNFVLKLNIVKPLVAKAINHEISGYNLYDLLKNYDELNLSNYELKDIIKNDYVYKLIFEDFLVIDIYQCFSLEVYEKCIGDTVDELDMNLYETSYTLNLSENIDYMIETMLKVIKNGYNK